MSDVEIGLFDDVIEEGAGLGSDFGTLGEDDIASAKPHFGPRPLDDSEVGFAIDVNSFHRWCKIIHAIHRSNHSQHIVCRITVENSRAILSTYDINSFAHCAAELVAPPLNMPPSGKQTVFLFAHQLLEAFKGCSVLACFRLSANPDRLRMYSGGPPDLPLCPAAFSRPFLLCHPEQYSGTGDEFTFALLNIMETIPVSPSAVVSALDYARAFADDSSERSDFVQVENGCARALCADAAAFVSSKDLHGINLKVLNRHISALSSMLKETNDPGFTTLEGFCVFHDRSIIFGLESLSDRQDHPDSADFLKRAVKDQSHHHTIRHSLSDNVFDRIAALFRDGTVRIEAANAGLTDVTITASDGSKRKLLFHDKSANYDPPMGGSEEAVQFSVALSRLMAALKDYSVINCEWKVYDGFVTVEDERAGMVFAAILSDLHRPRELKKRGRRRIGRTP
jgi:hypothetical protein